MLLELVQALGLPVALFVAIIYMGARGLWVFGWQYQATAERAERWEQVALALLHTNEAAVKAVELAAEKAVEAVAKTERLEQKLASQRRGGGAS